MHWSAEHVKLTMTSLIIVSQVLHMSFQMVLQQELHKKCSKKKEKKFQAAPRPRNLTSKDHLSVPMK